MKENFEFSKDIQLGSSWKDIGISKESFEACIRFSKISKSLEKIKTPIKSNDLEQVLNGLPEHY